MPIKYDKNGNLKTVNKKTTTQYSSAYPALYIEHCKQGKSSAQFCRDVNICRETLNDWCNRYPEMGKARQLGKLFAEAWHLDLAHDHLISYEDGPQLNTVLYKFLVGGRFGHSGRSKPRNVNLNTKDLCGSMQVLIQARQEGRVDSTDFAILADALLKAATLEQHEVLSKEVKELKELAYKNNSERIGEIEGEL